MLYIEAEQRAPLSPKGSWGAVPAAGAGWGVVGGSPAPRGDSSDGEGLVGPALFAALWGPHVQEGDPVGIITIEDVIEEARGAVWMQCRGLWHLCCCTLTDDLDAEFRVPTNVTVGRLVRVPACCKRVVRVARFVLTRLCGSVTGTAMSLLQLTASHTLLCSQASDVLL